MNAHVKNIRLYIAKKLVQNAFIALDENQAHYLHNVMRLVDGDLLLAFNGEDGQYQARLAIISKRESALEILEKIADSRPCPDVSLAFAMIKNKSELVVEKATELGVREIHAIITQHSVVKEINIEKLEKRSIEAAEQCERFDIPFIKSYKNLADFISLFPKNKLLLYGDESGKGRAFNAENFKDELLKYTSGIKSGVCILIGPEGGFSANEQRILQAADFALAFGIGPRILRADTAAIAALACVMSMVGDWHERPHFNGNN